MMEKDRKGKDSVAKGQLGCEVGTERNGELSFSFSASDVMRINCDQLKCCFSAFFPPQLSHSLCLSKHFTLVFAILQACLD